jgi:DNA-binding transcriptional LysR family regulator
MDLRRFEHFLAVIECCSFGKAAKQLKITQSGLTKSIQALEESVGTPLFIRLAMVARERLGSSGHSV